MQVVSTSAYGLTNGRVMKQKYAELARGAGGDGRVAKSRNKRERDALRLGARCERDDRGWLFLFFCCLGCCERLERLWRWGN